MRKEIIKRPQCVAPPWITFIFTNDQNNIHIETNNTIINGTKRRELIYYSHQPITPSKQPVDLWQNHMHAWASYSFSIHKSDISLTSWRPFPRKTGKWNPKALLWLIGGVGCIFANSFLWVPKNTNITITYVSFRLWWGRLREAPKDVWKIQSHYWNWEYAIQLSKLHVVCVYLYAHNCGGCKGVYSV